jgi:hypothetical protein
MRRLDTIIALLLLLTTAAPVLACMTGSTMSHDENLCCRSMHGNCGERTKTGCCQTEVDRQHPQIAATVPSMDLHWAVIDWLTPASVALQPVQASFLHTPVQHSPPGLLTTQTTVLRI